MILTTLHGRDAVMKRLAWRIRPTSPVDVPVADRMRQGLHGHADDAE